MMGAFDEAWRRRALAGDREAVLLLSTEALPPLWRFCWFRTGRDRAFCEDVVQGALLRAIETLDAYDPSRSGGDIFPWLAGLARNEIRRERRAGRATRQAVPIDGALADQCALLSSEPLPGAALEREETRTLVNAALSALPPAYREALVEKYARGHGTRAVAAALGRSDKAAESILGRAREAFRAAFVELAKRRGLDASDEAGLPVRN